MFLYMQRERLLQLIVDNILEELNLLWETGILKLWLNEFSASFLLFSWVWPKISPNIFIDSFL